MTNKSFIIFVICLLFKFNEVTYYFKNEASTKEINSNNKNAILNSFNFLIQDFAINDNYYFITYVGSNSNNSKIYNRKYTKKEINFKFNYLVKTSKWIFLNNYEKNKVFCIPNNQPLNKKIINNFVIVNRQITSKSNLVEFGDYIIIENEIFDPKKKFNKIESYKIIKVSINKKHIVVKNVNNEFLILDENLNEKKIKLDNFKNYQILYFENELFVLYYRNYYLYSNQINKLSQYIRSTNPSIFPNFVYDRTFFYDRKTLNILKNENKTFDIQNIFKKSNKKYYFSYELKIIFEKENEKIKILTDINYLNYKVSKYENQINYEFNYNIVYKSRFLLILDNNNTILFKMEFKDNINNISFGMNYIIIKENSKNLTFLNMIDYKINDFTIKDYFVDYNFQGNFLYLTTKYDNYLIMDNKIFAKYIDYFNYSYDANYFEVRYNVDKVNNDYFYNKLDYNNDDNNKLTNEIDSLKLITKGNEIKMKFLNEKYNKCIIDLNKLKNNKNEIENKDEIIKNYELKNKNLEKENENLNIKLKEQIKTNEKQILEIQKLKDQLKNLEKNKKSRNLFDLN